MMLFRYQVVRHLVSSLNSTLLTLLQCCSATRECVVSSSPQTLPC